MRPTFSKERKEKINQQRAESEEWLKTHRSSTDTRVPLTAKEKYDIKYKAQTEERIARQEAAARDKAARGTWES